jgi:hypothetical protein
MSSEPSFDQATFANITAAFGPTSPEPTSSGSSPRWYRGAHGGAPVWLGLLVRGGIKGITFAASLGGRPAYLTIRDRRTTSLVGTPEVRTGDPRFDGAFVVGGWPKEVIVEALDGPARDWLLATWGGADPQITTERDRIELFRSLATFGGSLGVGSEAAPTPEELSGWASAVLRLSQAVTASFDRAHAAIAASGGPAAAAAWVDAQRAIEAAQGRALRRFRLYVFGGVGLFALLVLAAIALVVLR